MSSMIKHLGSEPFSVPSMRDVLKKLNPIELRKYNRLRKPLPNQIDKDYKDRFKDFYYCTDMTREYEEIFFSILEGNYEENITFDFVLQTTVDETEKCYPFLCSNLVNIVDEEQPIFSANNLIALGLDNFIFRGKRLSWYNKIYRDMKKGLKNEFNEEWFGVWKYEFKDYFSDYKELLGFSDMKMIDLFCWRNKAISDFGKIKTSYFNVPYEITYVLSGPLFRRPRIRRIREKRESLPKTKSYSSDPHILRRARIDDWLQLLQKGLFQYLEYTIDYETIPDFINHLENRGYVSHNDINDLRELTDRNVVKDLDLSNTLRLIEFNHNNVSNIEKNIIRKIRDIRNKWAHPNIAGRMGMFGDSEIREVRELSNIILMFIKRDIQDSNDIGTEFSREYEKNEI